MPKKRHSVEAIIAMLREADVLIAKGQPLIEIIRQFGISDATYYKWRKQYGGLQVDQASRRLLSNPGVHGRTDTLNHSTGNLGMNS